MLEMMYDSLEDYELMDMNMWSSKAIVIIWLIAQYWDTSIQ